MKYMMRTMCALAAVAALSGCGVPKEQHQALQDKLTAAEQQLAKAQEDLTTLQNSVQQKDAEVAAANQKVESMVNLLRKKQVEIDSLKGGPAKPAAKTPAKAKHGKSSAPAARHATAPASF